MSVKASKMTEDVGHSIFDSIDKAWALLLHLAVDPLRLIDISYGNACRILRIACVPALWSPGGLHLAGNQVERRNRRAEGLKCGEKSRRARE